MTNPTISTEFLQWLEHLFPDTVPRSGDSADLFRKQGEQRVLDKLRAEHREQTSPTIEDS